MDERDLLRGDAPGDELGAYVVVDGERRFVRFFVRRRFSGVNPRIVDLRRSGSRLFRRGGQIAEDKLRQPFGRSFLPDPEYVVHAQIDFACRIVRKVRIDDPLIQPQFPPVRCHFQHVVGLRIDHFPVDCGRPFGQVLHHFILDLRGFCGHIVKLRFRDRQMKLIGGLDVRRFPEQVHEFGEVVEFGKPRPRPVARSLRGQFNRRLRLPEGRSPGVEMGQPFPLQHIVLEVAHHGVQFGHAVRYRRTRRKDDAFPACDLVHVPAFEIHIARFLRVRCGQARHIPHLRDQKEVFIVMRFIDVKPVHAELFKRHHVVPRLVEQLVQLCLQTLSRAFQLLDGGTLPPACFQFFDLALDLVDLLAE